MQTYKSFNQNEYAIHSVVMTLPIFGRFCDFSFTFYNISREISINYGMLPSKDAGMALEATCKDIFTVTEPRRQLEQSIVIPKLSGGLVNDSDLLSEGEVAADTVAESICSKIESVVETVRQSIRNNLSKSCQDVFLKMISTRYDKFTAEAVKKSLKSINWRFLFNSSTPEDFFESIESYFNLNSPRVFSILFDGDTEITACKHEYSSAKKINLPDLKALTLLGKVCGQFAREEFKRNGRITVVKDGYSFILSPFSTVEAIDPLGNRARLCVHTHSFSCNPIDELTIGYLHIQNKMADYIKKANIFHSSCSEPFIPPWELIAAKKA